MQKSLYQTADAGDTLSESGCRRLSIRQRMQKPLYQTADAVNTLITQRMQESLNQITDAGGTLSDAAAV